MQEVVGVCLLRMRTASVFKRQRDGGRQVWRVFMWRSKREKNQLGDIYLCCQEQIGNYCWVYSAHAAVFIRNTEKTCGPDAPSQCFCSWDLNQKPSGSQSRLSWCQISVVKCSGRSLLRFPSLASETNPDSSSSYSLYLL